MKLRGFTCPECRGVRLFVYKTRRPCAGRIIRYRKCLECGFRATTEERFGRVLPKPGKREVVRKNEVFLTADERRYLTDFIDREKVSGWLKRRARIILAVDQSEGRPARSTEEIGTELKVGKHAAQMVRKLVAEHRGEDRIWHVLWCKKPNRATSDPAEQGKAA